jgi:hypothetical protein
MENDPNVLFEDDAGGNSISDESAIPPDDSWSEFFDGIWRRMTDPVPPTMSA